MSAGDESVVAAYDTVAADYARLIPGTSFEAPLDLAMIDEFARRVHESIGVTAPDTPGGGSRSGKVGDGGVPVRAGIAASPSLLDAGCGAGRMSVHLSRLGCRVRGIDASSGMVAQAREAHPELRFDLGDLRALPCGDEEFSGVLAWYSLIHLDADECVTAFREFRRVLRPGGLILAGFQHGSGPRMIRGAYGHDVEMRAVLHDTEGLGRLLAAEGFAVEVVLRRAAGPQEATDQGFVLARLPGSG